MQNKNLWFKRKTYGYGWVPVTWQGWILTFGYIAILVLLGITMNPKSSLEEMLVKLFIPVFTLTVVFLSITYKKGERPRFQWGEKD